MNEPRRRWHVRRHRPIQCWACLTAAFFLLALNIFAGGILVRADSGVVAVQSSPPAATNPSPPPQLEVLLLAWNEAHLLPYTVRFYRTCFPAGAIQITVYDNESTDDTRALAMKLGCRVRKWKTGQSLSVRGGQDLRNRAWKASTADWVLISDMDEWVDVWPDRLAAYEVADVTAVRARGAYLVWPTDTLDLSQQPRGVWDERAMVKAHGVPSVRLFDKPALFYRSAINDTGITVGGHSARPTGRIKWLHQTPIPAPTLFHAKFFDAATIAARYALYRPRMTQDNIKHNWGAEYMRASNSTVQAQFEHMRQVSEPLPWRIF